MNLIDKTYEECQGCCYKKNCDNSIEKCAYYINYRCSIRETRKYGDEQ